MNIAKKKFRDSLTIFRGENDQKVLVRLDVRKLLREKKSLSPEVLKFFLGYPMVTLNLTLNVTFNVISKSSRFF